ncbi:MAG: UDP-N-acetylmuramoyl-L-alanyl-D-glutamate--2,6-diaminopimelate ligase [Gammaproteobacteria bacterium]
MKPIKLSQLLYNLYDTPIYSDVEIKGLALDSRNVKPGDLFFACKGATLDGRKFIGDAIKHGAVAVLEEVESKSMSFHKQANIPIFPVHHLDQRIGEIAAHFYGYPSKKLKMVGVTGTNGKTSCSHFIAQALQKLEIPCGVIGTLGNGLYGDIKSGSLTTPDAITLQATLAEFLDQHIKNVAMEVSSHSIEQGRVNGTQFDVGVFTNLTRDHLDYHLTMEAYGNAKKKFIESHLVKHVVINADDEFGLKLIKSLARKNIYAYGIDKHTDLPGAVPLVYAQHTRLDLSGIRAKVVSPWGEGELIAPLIGKFNLSNLLATLTSLCILKVPFKTALDSLAKLISVPGRMQTFGGIDKPLVVVDYAHTPDALEKVLIALREHNQGKLYCLLGCGGDRDKGKRHLMAKIAEQYADKIIVTDDNPRTEDPAQIVADIMEGFTDRNKIIVEHDRSKAIRDIIQYAQPGDCVLVAGKGAERYQIIGDKKIPFSDIEKVEENL